jgi:hypothetical protein
VDGGAAADVVPGFEGAADFGEGVGGAFGYRRRG